MPKDDARASIAAVVSLALAAIVSVVLWNAFVRHQRPNIYARPHFSEWEAICLAKAGMGEPYHPPLSDQSKNPLIVLAAWSIRTFGETYRNLAAAELPFLFLLIASLFALAWRFGGPFAAGIVPWVAILSPMTLGASFLVNDILPLQACTAAMSACVAWSNARKGRHVTWLIAVPAWLTARVAVWFTHAILATGAFAAFAGPLLTMRALAQRRSGMPVRRIRDYPWFDLAVAGVGLGIVFWAIAPDAYWEYILRELGTERFAGNAAAHDRRAHAAYLAAFVLAQAEPPLAILAVLGLAATLAWSKKRAGAVAAACWLFGPMMFLGMLNKRLEYYQAAAIPASYLLVALGVAAIPKRRARIGVAAACVAILAANWAYDFSQPAFREHRAIDRWFAEGVRSYLASPFATPVNEDPALGRMINRLCPENLPVVALDGPLSGGPETIGIPVWTSRPKRPFGTVLYGPDFDGPVCFVAEVGFDKTLPSSPAEVLANLKRPVDAPDFEEWRDRFLARVDAYLPAAHRPHRLHEMRTRAFRYRLWTPE
ncbi:hypothetical protein K8I61_02950 [bacterium]|nr:hypothetical protein [bacterium]